MLRISIFIFLVIGICSFQAKKQVFEYGCATKVSSISGARTTFHGVRSCGTCPPVMRLVVLKNGDSVYLTHAKKDVIHNTVVCEKVKGSINTCPQILLLAPICPEGDKAPKRI